MRSDEKGRGEGRGKCGVGFDVESEPRFGDLPILDFGFQSGFVLLLLHPTLKTLISTK